MMQIRTWMMLLFASCCLGSCVTSKPGSTARQFQSAERYPESKLLSTGLTLPQIMTIFRDSLLLVVNNLNQDPFHVRVFDIARKRQVSQLFPAGHQRGGTLSFMSFGITDSLIWVFDVAKNGFIVGDIQHVLAGRGAFSEYAEYRITPQVFYYDAVLLSKDHALMNANYDTDEKLARVDLRTLTSQTILSYRDDPGTDSSRVSRMAYESFIRMKPDKSKLLMACRYSDQFELVDLVNGTTAKFSGPEGFKPELEPFESSTGVTVGTWSGGTRYGFLKGHVTDQYCYLLYSGFPVRSSRQFFSNRILVYDWTGKPIRQIMLKNDIVDFDVSSDDQKLYTLNPVNGVVGVVNMNDTPEEQGQESLNSPASDRLPPAIFRYLDFL